MLTVTAQVAVTYSTLLVLVLWLLDAAVQRWERR